MQDGPPSHVEPSPGDPEDVARLHMVPVLLVPTPGLLETVMAGLTRAGRGPRIAEVFGTVQLASLLERGTTAEVVVIHAEVFPGLGNPVDRLLQRGAKPVPVLQAHVGTGVLPASVQQLSELPNGLNVPVPSIEDDDERWRLWSTLRDAGLDEWHHLVDVDGHPALDELAERGTAVEGDLVELLAAGAAGVLAGRIVVGNRRWKLQLGG